MVENFIPREGRNVILQEKELWCKALLENGKMTAGT